MSKQVFSYKSKFPVKPEELFAWHKSQGAFEALTPFWEDVKVKSKTGSITDGDRVELETGMGPVKLPWVIEHQEYKENEQFVDLQTKGPFSYWRHEHLFNSDAELEDRIEYELPLGFLGQIFGSGFVTAKLDRLFRFRHKATELDLKLINKYKTNTLKILISGSTGMVGSELIAFLTRAGHKITTLKRGQGQDEASIYWDPEHGFENTSMLEGFDVVIHLAGENIAGKRWDNKQKAKIRNSRVIGTHNLSMALAKLKYKPKLMISASAIGIYEDNEFLAETCRDWEAATQAASDAGIRVAHARFGVIISPMGGALSKFLLPFQMGAGGILGNGKQHMSWVALNDVIGALYHIINTKSLSGAVNITAPNPVTNYEMTKILGKVLSRPTIFPVPSFAARVVFGEMADALLLNGSEVLPSQLQETGYDFAFAELEPAFRHLLGK